MGKIKQKDIEDYSEMYLESLLMDLKTAASSLKKTKVAFFAEAGRHIEKACGLIEEGRDL